MIKTKKRILSLLLAFMVIIPSLSAIDVAVAADPVNIAYRRPAYASLYQNTPASLGTSVTAGSWSTSDTATSLPSYDETAMNLTDGIIGDVNNPLAYPIFDAFNINGTKTAGTGVSAVTVSNLGNMINGQTLSTGTATLSVSTSAPISATNPLILKATLSKPEKVMAYSMLNQLGNSTVTNKPHAWSMQASKTGGDAASEWVTIDSYTLTQTPGSGSLSGTNASSPFNGMDVRFVDASGFPNGLSFYTYNGSAQATAGVRRDTTCNDYYQYYRMVVTRTNATSTTSGVSVGLADFALFAETPGGGLRNVLRNPFISRWRSTASAAQWVYVDLGENVSYDSLKLFWGKDSYATNYTVQVSNDVSYNYGNGGGTGENANSTWTTIATQTEGAGGTEEISFPLQTARYLKINMTSRVSGSSDYKLYELEVYGERDEEPYANPSRPAPEADGFQELTGGDWKLARAEEMTVTGEQLSVAGYDDSAWLPAKVPGTALMSYVNAGVLPDPNFDMNMMFISDTYFYSDWWYRTSFDIPADKAGQSFYLNFSGINWKAKVFINGKAISDDANDIEGSFIRGKFDISGFAGVGKNYLAVHISPPEHYATAHTKSYSTPNTNGGLLGADNPTFHASANWDWVPTIRGRDTGIYDKVFLSYSGGVNLVDPWVVTEFDKARQFSDNDLLSDLKPSDDPAYDFSKAHTTLKTEVSNTTGESVTAVVTCAYEPSGVTFSSAPIVVAPGAIVPVEMKADIANPQVWWPNCYGEQPLYTATVKVSVDGVVKDENTFRFGVRQLVFTYTPPTGSSFPSTSNFGSSTQSDSALNVFCNGVRIFCRGGNWGMDDSNVDLTYEGYRVRVKLHAEENFTMIRNWVGMTMKEEFYDACDEYGILVWDDFWLANPWDGPDPLDNDMFIANARDKIKVVRKHASMAIYCTRNESVVARPLDSNLQASITELDGTRAYVRSSDSAVFGINGHGPYTEQERKAYFYGSNSANFQLHTERGQHVIPNYEVLAKYFRPENMWPGYTSASTTAHPWRTNVVAANVWGVHDFFMGGNGPATNFFSQLTTYATFATLADRYNSIEGFTTVSQLPNYDLHRAMFEGFVEKKGSGLLMWMSMSAWPSFAWRTFDYYYDTSSAYFGIKKACEPLGIIWNPTNSAAATGTSNSSTYNPRPGEIAIVNNSGKVLTNLKAVAKIYSMNGELLKTVFETDIPLLSVDQLLSLSTAANSALWTTTPTSTRVKFLKLEVFDDKDNLLTDNFYWRDTVGETAATSAPNYTEMQNMPKVSLEATAAYASSDVNSNYYSVVVKNNTDNVAIQVRVKAADDDGEIILPVYYSDNYFSLLPGESKTVTVDVEKLYFDDFPEITISGFNVNEAEVQYLIDADHDATLASFAYGGQTFTVAPGVYEYDVNIPANVSAISAFAAANVVPSYPNDVNVSVELSPASGAVPCVATVKVVSKEHSKLRLTYKINFGHLTVTDLSASVDAVTGWTAAANIRFGDGATTYRLYFAVYAGGKLVEVKEFEKGALALHSSGVISENIPLPNLTGVSGAITLKVFLWDQDFIPLAPNWSAQG
ncbi:MAG: discoidin domain-containing protein [Oscillospiraceae bacterium]|nr:discoidin domain-containing protein [Oscillospiraceae bacterium]